MPLHTGLNEQTAYNNAIQWYNLRTFPRELENRRFDGSLFCPEKSKGLFAEVNNFNSSGSKLYIQFFGHRELDVV